MAHWIRNLIIIIGLWPAVSLAGWIVGNGGDGIRLQFQKAKEHAAHLTIRVSGRALLSVTTPEVKDWVLAHQKELAADILASDHDWTTDEKPTCAWTTQEPAAVINFSFPTCLRQTASFNAAGTILIHESVHHLGVDSESFADAVALAIYDAHRAGKVDWLDVAGSGAPSARASHAMVWTGSEMFVQGGLVGVTDRTVTNSAYAYNPESNRWRALSSQGAPARYDQVAIAHQGNVILWGGLTASTGNNVSETWHNSGAIYDTDSNTWTTIANPYGPDTLDIRIDGKAQTAVIVGDELIVWGGAVNGRGGRQAAPGAAMNLRTGTWRQIASNGPARLQDHVAVNADGKMLVWGGVDVNNRASEDGAIYDPVNNTWSSITSRNAPSGLDAPVAVWTGSRLVVFGGYYSSREIRGLGGQYDPSTDTWSSFVSEVAIGRKKHSAVWTGQEMIVFGGWNSRLRAEFGTPVAYDPESGTWRAMTSVNGPRERARHGAVWTGSKMIVWGGTALGGQALDSGSLFYP